MMMMNYLILSPAPKPRVASTDHKSPQTQAFFQAKILITDHDLPRAFCLVNVPKMLFFLQSQAVGLHFVMGESQRFGRGFFDVLEGEKCIFECLCI